MKSNSKTQQTYDIIAKDYEKRNKDFNRKYLKNEINLFLKTIKGKKTLDLGSGPGDASLIFKQKGFQSICIDFSESMIQLCKEKGLKAYKLDMEHLDFKDNSFDAVWAYTSIMHLPKNKIPNILKKISELLKKDGIFYIGMIEGEFEGLKPEKNDELLKRYWSLYTKKELDQLLSKNFEIIHFSKIRYSKNYTFLNFMCKKKDNKK